MSEQEQPVLMDRDGQVAILPKKSAAKPDVPRETKPLAMAAGKKTTARIASTDEDIDVQLAIVEGDDLITSHALDGTPIKAYPEELQPRDRSKGSSKLQVQKIANNLRPELLEDNGADILLFRRIRHTVAVLVRDRHRSGIHRIAVALILFKVGMPILVVIQIGVVEMRQHADLSDDYVVEPRSCLPDRSYGESPVPRDLGRIIHCIEPLTVDVDSHARTVGHRDYMIGLLCNR